MGSGHPSGLCVCQFIISLLFGTLFGDIWPGEKGGEGAASEEKIVDGFVVRLICNLFLFVFFSSVQIVPVSSHTGPPDVGIEAERGGEGTRP